MPNTRALWQRVLIRTGNIAVLALTADVLLLHIFPYFDHSHSLVVSVLLTYLLAAYLLFPFSVRLSGALTRRQRVARYTASVDGLATDPVNIIIIGSFKQLKLAYQSSGWHMADELNFKSAQRMVISFIRNKPYLTAPFSNLYLFGRRQDVGFQKAVGNSPRQRHHVRYWALNSSHKLVSDLSVAFWHGQTRANLNRARVWVGAGTKDTGLGLARTTLQITHSVDKDTIRERQFMIKELKRTRLVDKVEIVQPHHPVLVGAKKANSFITDGRVAVVYLK